MGTFSSESIMYILYKTCIAAHTSSDRDAALKETIFTYVICKVYKVSANQVSLVCNQTELGLAELNIVS